VAVGNGTGGAELLVGHVSRTYSDGVRALEDVSFRLQAGELRLLSPA
jgi:hypothetical protein